MIGEFIVRPGKLQFRHVARHAILIGNGAVFGARMAGQTFTIVKRICADYFLMNVVASHATDPFVGTIVALAGCQSIRLEAKIVNVVWSIRGDLRPSSMTLAAEIGQLLRVEGR